MQRILVCLALFGVLAGLARPAHSWGSEDAGTSAAGLLAQNASARLQALAGAGTALAAGAPALGWNPAGLASETSPAVELSLRRYFGDTELSYLQAALPTAWGVPGFGLAYSQTRDIPGYDASDQSTGSFSTHDFDLALGWGLKLQNWEGGLALHVLSQDVHVERIPGWSADAGAAFQPWPWLKTGLAVLRLGKTSYSDPTPAEFRGGASWEFLPKSFLSCDLVFPRDRSAYLAAGCEWKPFDLLALRAGWKNGPEETENLGGLSWMSLGAGFAWEGVTLDYAFQPESFLGSTHQLTLGYRYTPATPPPPAATPAPAVAPARDLQAMPAPSGENVLILRPRELGADYSVREATLTLLDKAGRVAGEFHYAGKDVPREFVWDGKDRQGQNVPMSGLHFQYTFLTDRGKISRQQVWPNPLPAKKLFFASGGLGVEPEVLFQFEPGNSPVPDWNLTILEAENETVVRRLAAPGPLPARVEWDGKNREHRWASPQKKYAYRLWMKTQDGSEMALRNPILPVSAVALPPHDRPWTFKIVDLRFNFRDASIRGEISPALDKAAEIRENKPRAALRVVGHACEIGSRAANQKLSEKRAELVKEYLIARGSSRNLQTLGKGKSLPIYHGADEDRQAVNRRVEIFFRAAPAKQ